MRIRYLLDQKYVIYLLPIAVLAAGARAFPLIEKFYYILPVLLLYFILAGFREIKSDKYLRTTVLLLLLFTVWCLTTSLWSSYPVITICRSLYFGLVSAGSVTGAYIYIKAKGKLDLNFLLPLNIFILLISIISLILKMPEDAWTGGNGMGFKGFAAHQNTLGASILFTFPVNLWVLVKELKLMMELKIKNSKLKISSGRQYNKLRLAASTFLLTTSLIILVLTHSRASILSVLVMVLIISLFLLKIKIIIILISSIILLLSWGYTYTGAYFKLRKYLFKNETNFGDNRYFMYKDSYRAAVHGGLTGLGYGISDPEIHNEACGSHYENGRYIREKGNSVLALIEEVGIIGLGLFLLPIFYVMYQLKIQNSKLKIKIQYSNIRIQHPVSSIQYLESSIQHPASSI